MITKKQLIKWHNKLYDVEEEIKKYMKNLDGMKASEMEKIEGYDVRLHQHLHAFQRSLEGATLLLDQIRCDIANKKYTGDL